MVDLPTGTVTFLFTDVENSTRLVEELGAAYSDVIGDHRRILRKAIRDAGGHEIDCRGDEFFTAFQRTRDAVAAALAAQRAVAEHAWPTETPLRVRMGVYTGEPVISEGGYVGLDVHRAARICSAGHGGQILVSQTTHDLLPAEQLGIEVRDLGEHELKGLTRPERLFQLVAPGLRSDFPPLRGGDVTGAAAEASGDGAPRLRAVLADDSVLLREGIARLLADVGFEVVGQSADADDLLLKVRSYRPDVAIVDIRMPPTHTDEGLRAAQEIRTNHPDVGVLVLSQYVEPTYAMDLLAESAEGVGYLLKDRVADVDEFAAAVRRVAEGGSALDPALVTQLVGRRRKHDPMDDLTAREREVLELMAEGRSNQAIGERLFITPRAVEKHITSIFGKLRLPPAPEDHRRVLAVLAFLRS
ncbi:MAG: response regulator [Thermoleophilia bacterium]|nr:response regulator [Thermoleophilia bacterium]